jgi:hypothetical protein
MIGTYLKVVLGLIVGFAIVAATLTVGFIVLIGVAIAGAVLLVWYRIKRALAPETEIFTTTTTRRRESADALEVEYEVVQTTREKGPQE